ncbi:MAG: substrate-binding domain-containing protein [Bryobacterales bacterium]|nr:substrate-binding domain-containing protein [Bryobacterales bacterium]
MKMKLIAALILSIVLLLSGCSSSPSHVSTEKYFLVCTNTKIPYWQEAGSGFFAAARELRVQAEMVGPESYDANAERDEFRRVVGLKPAGILISPGNAEILKPEIDAAIGAGIPVITIDSDAPESKRLFFIGTNNFQAGQLGGKRLAELLKGKGTVTFFTIKGQENLKERLNGYESVLEGYPNIKIADVVDMKGDPRVTFDTMMDHSSKKTLTDAYVALESLSGSEVAEVLDRNKIEGKVVIAMDTAANTLDWVQKGKVAATVMQKPYTMGYYGLKALGEIVLQKPAAIDEDYAINPHSPYPYFVDTGTLLVDQSNIAQIRR